MAKRCGEYAILVREAYEAVDGIKGPQRRELIAIAFEKILEHLLGEHRRGRRRGVPEGAPRNVATYANR